MNPSSSWDILTLGQSLQAQEFLKPQAQTGIWVLNRKPSPAAKIQEKLSSKPAMVSVQGKPTLKTLARKGLVMFFKRKRMWTYLIKPLVWFLFTPHSRVNKGCRNVAQQQTQQRMPGHLWGLHCHYFLVFYPLWCREESSPFSKRETEARRPQFRVCRNLTGHNQLPLEAAGELLPLSKISAWISHPQISLFQSAPSKSRVHQKHWNAGKWALETHIWHFPHVKKEIIIHTLILEQQKKLHLKERFPHDLVHPG